MTFLDGAAPLVVVVAAAAGRMGIEDAVLEKVSV